MSKHIIDFPDGVEWGVVTCRTEDGFYTKDFDSLEELNSDYINEHFGELQDEAYRKGFEDGKNSIDMGCEGCRYSLRFAKDEPCKSCSNCYKSKYDPMPKEDDRIEVGDEVNWDGDCFIVTKIFQPRNMKEQCDGIDDDGSVYHDILMEDLKKTGKHYDIASILEAMRT
jgi:hypothetical protein